MASSTGRGEALRVVGERAKGVEEGAGDGELLRRFEIGGDEGAFELLVRRHGPRVMAACRRLMGPGQDADDVFQATFVVLARRAGSIRRGEALGPWLAAVARRIAMRVGSRAAKRRTREVALAAIGDVPDRSEAPDHDVEPVVRDEVGRLPEKYRRPIELCYWEGLTTDEAADRLDCPAGTLKWRLVRAREILHDRLVRRGIALIVLALAGFRGGRADAAVPDRLARATVSTAARERRRAEVGRRTPVAKTRRARPGVVPVLMFAAIGLVGAAAWALPGAGPIAKPKLPPAECQADPTAKPVVRDPKAPATAECHPADPR